MAGAGDLHAAATELLEACETALATVPAVVPGGLGVPDISYVTFGEPAADCEQLTVHVERIGDASTNSGLQEGTRHRSMRMPQPLFIATLFRCVPTLSDDGDPPSSTELTVSARQLHADGWALHNVLFNMLREGELFEFCRNVVWDGIRRYGPAGAFGGWIVTIRAELDGYN